MQSTGFTFKKHKISQFYDKVYWKITDFNSHVHNQKMGLKNTFFQHVCHYRDKAACLKVNQLKHT